MICPFCQHGESKVVDSREAEDGIRRRRECLGCGDRFTTYERLLSSALLVIKRDGRREEFSWNKLLSGLQKACIKRPEAVGQLERVVHEIEGELQRLGRSEVPSRVIGELVMEKLKQLDWVAYVRFASVYREFEAVDSFQEEVAFLTRRSTGRSGQPSDGRGQQLALLPAVEVSKEQVSRASARRRGLSASRRLPPAMVH